MTTKLREQTMSGAPEDRDAQLTQRVIEAAERCLDKLGLDKTTVDDIAREAEISRATLYRRFGSKEAIFGAALQRQSRPFESEATAILNGPGNLCERVERLLVWAVIETPENVLLKRLLGNETTQAGVQIFNQVFRKKVSTILLPVVDAAKTNGELREDLDPEFLVDWIIRELLMIKMAAPWQEADLRKHIHHFIKPVLVAVPDMPAATSDVAPSMEDMHKRLINLEQRLVEVHQLLGQVRQDIQVQSIRTC
ncbi:TetR/AcrR family transcriptional regulator [Pseudomonas sp. PB120]|uniref:TetR/AcrR family transcriptional regulator n=1 Tax=Pseudomonas sp. PB120 TaxID=2494700 RepID=UPI0012FE5E6D|nr:TetR/AcrR family transcriptional regulator [Pseudomonas sp. PB120]MVV48830.1 TetR/AcrR family transcriptional regulator [Pseudomonas sp. PB120]